MTYTTIKVVEMTSGWGIIWPSGRLTVAPSAGDALRRVQRHSRRHAPSVVKVIWDPRTTLGGQVVRALL